MFTREQLDEYRRVLDSDPRERLIMSIARRTDRPWSQVAEMWEDDDLGREIVWDEILWEDAAKRCPDCGIHPDEMLRAGSQKLSANASHRLAQRRCPFCEEADELNWRAEHPDGSGGTYKPRPSRWSWIPRLEGEAPAPEVDLWAETRERVRQARASSQWTPPPETLDPDPTEG